MKRRFYTSKDYVNTCDDVHDYAWSVYDREQDHDETQYPMASFRHRADAQDYARRLNRTRSSR